MNKIWILRGLFILAITSTYAYHEYYVGLTEIEYNATTQRCEVAIKVFTDDLELAIQSQTGTLSYLGTKKELPDADSLVHAYAKATFSLGTGSITRLPLTYIGRETELDITWIYLESEPLQPLTSLRVSNSMFTELYDSQVHIINLKSGGQKYSTLLRKGNTTDTLGS